MGHGASAHLTEILARSRALGFLGPTTLDLQIEHARGFAAALAAQGVDSPASVIDLGSGGGLPGLVLSEIWPEARIILMDGSVRRCEFLSEVIEEFGLSEHVSVLAGRAEDLGHREDLRGAIDVVVARSFGPPAVTAECGAPFLVEGGALVVSEPPEAAAERWPAEGVATLGLGPATSVVEGSHFVVLRQAALCPERYPRRVGVPAKRPLF